MNPTSVLEREPEVIESSVDTPDRGTFHACDQCGSWSYMFYYYKDGLFNFCGHHGERNFEALTDKGARLVADYRDDLKENRLQGQA